MSTNAEHNTRKNVISLLNDYNSPLRQDVARKRRKRHYTTQEEERFISLLDDADDNNSPPKKKSSIVTIIDDDYGEESPVKLVKVSATSKTRTAERPKMSLRERILELYPDMDQTYLEQTLLSRYFVNDRFGSGSNSINSILQHIVSSMENFAYPKRPKAASTSTHSPQNEPQHEFDNPSYSQLKLSHSYKIDCPIALSQLYPFLSIKGIHNILQNHQHRYTLAVKYIQTTLGCSSFSNQNNNQEEGDEEFQLTQFQNVISGQRPIPPKNNHNQSYFPSNYLLAKPRRRNYQNSAGSTGTSTRTVIVKDPILKQEIQFVQTKLDEWKASLEQKFHRKVARQKSEQQGNLFECQCCFSSVAFEELISCIEEGHLFCIDCVVRYLQQQIYSNQTANLSCLDTSSNCKSSFSYAQLQNHLPPKLLQAYNQLQTTKAIQTAIPQQECQICTCPACNTPTLLPTTQKILTCPHCHHESCIHCQKPPHIPLTCQEVEKDKQTTNHRTTIEEAMTQALIRQCPKCKTKFVKENGCNKMTCPKCHIFVCYICQKEIPKSIGYGHFCQVPHCSHRSCGKCCLYDNDEMQRQSIRRAGLQAAQQLEQSTSEVQKIDVDALLKKPRASRDTYRRRYL